MDSKKLALRVSLTARNKKAQKIIVLDMRRVAGFCDYFVILSATSLRHTNAISQAILEDLAKYNIKPLSKVNSGDESGWVVLDFTSVIAHIFYKPMREFYALEHLWSDAKRVKIPSKRK